MDIMSGTEARVIIGAVTTAKLVSSAHQVQSLIDESESRGGIRCSRAPLRYREIRDAWNGLGEANLGMETLIARCTEGPTVLIGAI